MAKNIRADFEDATIIFKNFDAKPTRFNKQGGKPGFSLSLDPDLADALVSDGWGVKSWTPKDSDEPVLHLPIKINFDYKPPKIKLINSTGMTDITEDTIATLQYAEIKSVDMCVNGKWYEDGGYYTAYLDHMYVTIREDRFAAKYNQEFFDSLKTEGE